MLIHIIQSWLLFLLPTVAANAADLEAMLAKIEQDTYTFAHEVEDILMKKCDFTTDETCYKANFERCTSELPYATCPGKDYAIQKCGSGKEGGCSGLFDFTSSVVTVAPNKTNPYFYQEADSDRIRDAVCTTLPLEEYMKETSEGVTSYWQSYNVFPPWMYFGTDEG